MLRPILTLLALLCVTGCLASPEPSGLCAGLQPVEDAHAQALLADGGDRSVVTGNRLLAAIDAGCGR